MPTGYTAKEVTKITGVSYQTLHLWAHSGFLRPSIAAAAGRGSERVYSIRDLVRLRVAHELRRGGISTRALRKVIGELRQVKLEKTPPRSQLIIAGDEVVIATTNDELIASMRRSDQTCLAFVLDLDKTFKTLHLHMNLRRLTPDDSSLEGQLLDAGNDILLRSDSQTALSVLRTPGQACLPFLDEASRIAQPGKSASFTRKGPNQSYGWGAVPVTKTRSKSTERKNRTG
jgi:DNA-binding transcriptional MerR regulator